MPRFSKWEEQAYALDYDYLLDLQFSETFRKGNVWKIQNDLAKAAAGLGQTAQQIEIKVDLLFSTFAAEWAIYVLTGSPAIVTAIQNDVTLPWLDTDVSGLTIRQRLINRLS